MGRKQFLAAASLLVWLAACKSGDGVQESEQASPTTKSEATETGATKKKFAIPKAAQQLMAGGDCSPSSNYALRPFCAAVELEPKLKLPTTLQTLPGVTVRVSRGKTPKEIALKTTHFSVLLIDGKSALLQQVTPDNDDEQKQLAASAAGVMKVMRGEAKSVKLPSNLEGFLKSLGSRPRKNLKTEANFARFTASMPGRIYRSARGPSYVVFETMDSGDTYVSVFPDP